MAIKFFKLLDVLNKRGMSKGDLRKAANLSSVTMAKITKGESVTTEVINRICEALSLQPADIMEHIPDSPDEVNRTDVINDF